MKIGSVKALRETEPNKPLVERLMTAGLISEKQLRRAMREKGVVDRPLGRILVDLGMISEKVLNETLGKLLGDDSVDLATLLPNPRAVALLPRETAERYGMLPIEFDEPAGLLTLAVHESFSLADVDKVARSLDPDIGIATVIAAQSEIRAAVRKFYGVALTIPDILREIDADEAAVSAGGRDTGSYEHPLCRLIDAILFEAGRRNASAIHFEPEFGFVRVRFRIDGVLTQVMSLNREYWPEMAARLAAMSDVTHDPAAGSKPRRLPVMFGNRRKALYFSSRTTQRGDDAVVGIADQDAELLPLEQLATDSEVLTRLRLIMARPDGLIVIAGPPGSGKTTTLYSMLAYRSDESVSIATLEDTIRCHMPMIRQTSTEQDDTSEGLALENLVGQDSDVLVVDELLDQATAATALRAAMVGRQVFATLTAKSADAVLPRLRDFGLQSQLLAGNIAGIVAQRLIRALCANCKQSYAPQDFEREILGISASRNLRLYREGACSQCHYLGYRGRIAIFEVIVVDEGIDDLLARDATTQEIRWALSGAQVTEVTDEAVLQVLAGATSLSEVSRVVDLSVRLK